MGNPAQRLHYQGADWETDSWPVARAYDLIDRILDLCAYQDDPNDFQILPEGYHILCAMGDMLHDLKAQLILMEADLCPTFTENKLATRWRLFGAREVLREVQNFVLLATHIHKQALTVPDNNDLLPPSTSLTPEDSITAPVIDCAALFDRIESGTDKVRDLIKLVASA